MIVPVDVDVGADRSNAASPKVLVGIVHEYTGLPFDTVTLTATDPDSKFALASCFAVRVAVPTPTIFTRPVFASTVKTLVLSVE